MEGGGKAVLLSSSLAAAAAAMGSGNGVVNVAPTTRFPRKELGARVGERRVRPFTAMEIREDWDDGASWGDVRRRRRERAVETVA